MARRRKPARPAARAHASPRDSLDGLACSLVIVALTAVPVLFNPRGQAAFDVVKAGLLEVLGLLAGLVALLAARTDRRPLQVQPLLIAAGGVVAAYAAATAAGVAPALSFYGGGIRSEGLYVMLALGATAFAVSTFDASETNAILVAMIAGSIGPSVYAVAQSVILDMPYKGPDEFAARAGGTLGNPILLGGYLVVLMPITAAVAFSMRERSAGIWSILVIQTAALAATRAKGAALALAVAAAVAAAATIDLTERRRRLVAIAAGAFVAISAAATVMLVYHRYGTLIVGQTLRVRALIWRDVVRLIAAQRARLVLGYGPEMLQSMIAPFYTPDITSFEGTFAVPDRAHNDLLDTIVSAGVIGAAAVVALHALLIASLIRSIARFESAGARAPRLVAIGLLGAAVAHLVDIQTGVASITSRLVWWCCIGIAAARLRPDQSVDAPASGARDVVVWMSGGIGVAALVFAFWNPHHGLSFATGAVVAATAVVFAGVAYSLRVEPAVTAAIAPRIATAAAIPIAMTIGLVIWHSGAGSASPQDPDLAAIAWTALEATACLTFFAVVAVAVSVVRRGSVDASFGTRGIITIGVLVCAAAGLIMSAARPGRADILAEAAERLAGIGRWIDASRVEEERVAIVPENDRAWSALGGVNLEVAQRVAERERPAWFRRTADALAEANRRNPYEWLHLRNRASAERVWAAADREGRAEHLAAADRYFRQASERAPAFARLWAEWGNVDAERGDLRGAFEKLDRATTLHGGFDAKKVSDAILRALGTDLSDPGSRRRAGADLDRQGFHALAALYSSP